MVARTWNVAALALAALGMAACGDDPGAAAGAGALAQDRDTPAATLDDLVALGYAGWDDAPDPQRSGVVLHERARAFPAYGIHADDVDAVLLTDADGAVVHRWHVPDGRRVDVAELLEDGHVVAIDAERRIVRLDRASNVVWSVELTAHHEIARLASGALVVPFFDQERYRGRAVRFDGLAWIDPDDGRVLRRWRAREHLAALRALHPPLPLDEAPPPAPGADGKVYDYHHLNAVQELPATALGASDERFRAGNLLLCLRNASVLVVLDRDTLAPVWSWGPGELDFPHAPRLLASGRMLVFDNGWHRGWSRLVEIDPRTGRVAWEWRADPPERFFTKTRGAAQRLPNGNTLVCESERGRVFELAPDGDVVWEYRNPVTDAEGRRRRIYRFERVANERAAAVLRER